MASSAGTAQLQPGMDASGAAQKQPKAKKDYLCGTCCVVLNVVRLICEHPEGVCPVKARKD
eukprot:227574-Chlamydomonas_euryale.AAC.1